MRNPIQILLVEDNLADVRLIEHMLADTWPDVEVMRTDRLGEAFERIKEAEVSLVLLDLSLPDSQGIETLQRLRDRVKDMPVIVLTGDSDDDQAVRAVGAGAQDYLVKGEFDGRLLVRSMRYAIERLRAEKALRASETRYRVLAENVSDMIWTADFNFHFTDISPSVTRLLGITLEKALQLRLADTLTPESLRLLNKVITEELTHERATRGRDRFWSRTLEMQHVHADGSPIWVEVKLSLLRDEQGSPVGFLGITRDVRERKKSEEALRLSEARYRAVVEDQTDLICRFSPDYRLTFVNGAYCRYFERSRKDLIGNTFEPMIPPEDRKYVREQLAKISSDLPVVIYEHRVFTPSGEVRWQHWTSRGIFDAFGNVVEYQSVGRDITEQKQAEDNLRYMATHDQLTGLPNRVLFRDRLVHTLSIAHRYGQRVGLIILDLDHFKEINDSMGHDVGDMALQLIAMRLQQVVRRSDTVARLGGDEFTIILEGVMEEESILHVVDKVREAISQPLELEGREFIVTASVGLTLYPDHGSDPEGLLKNADIAMYRAKEKRDAIVIFDETLMNNHARGVSGLPAPDVPG
jgi:diguanylate cyclase (GGDEF)-like protein/PAS domain S-box-containing protein